jgi:hypothetical protein
VLGVAIIWYARRWWNILDPYDVECFVALESNTVFCHCMQVFPVRQCYKNAPPILEHVAKLSHPCC